MNEKANYQEQAMILSDADKAQNEKMEEMESTQGERIGHDGHNTSYPKRSSVVGLWRKREEAIKASNAVSKEKARDSELEEKKEGNREMERDSRQQDKIDSATLSHASKTVGSERNTPEPITDTTSDEDVEDSKHIIVNAPRRSNIRDSWKKKSANIPSMQLSQQSPNVEKTKDIVITASDSKTFLQSKSSLRVDSFLDTNLELSVTEPIDVSTSAKRSSICNSWRKRETLSSISSTSSSKEEGSEIVKLLPSIEMSRTSAITRTAESPSNAGSNAFDELKSKWAKFGVQKEDNPTTESDSNQMTETEVKEQNKESPSCNYVQPKDHFSGKTSSQDERSSRENPIKSSNKTMNFSSQRPSNSKVESFEKSSPDKDVTKQDSNCSGSYSSRAVASRRMGSKKFRSKYARKPLNASASSTDEIVGLTKNDLKDLVDSKQDSSNSSELSKRSSDHSVPFIKKELVPSFPLDETIQNESYVQQSKTNDEKNSGEVDTNRCRSFVPIRSDDLQTTTSTRNVKNSNQPPESISKDISIPVINLTSHQDNINKIAPNSPGSWCEDSPNTTEETESPYQKNSNISRSSLSSRANRRLRDIRIRNQTRREEDVENTSKETDMNIASGLTSSSRGTKANESYGRTLMPTDESTAFSQSLCSESTSANQHLHSTYASESTTENATFTASQGAQKSPLHGVVLDANEMVPDQFVSEKDANVESFKTAYDRMSFEQIANDMREEASSLFDVNILNEGVHSAINTFGLGDMFQTKSPKKASKRAPSPVEEVAIEVEYVADSD